MKHNLVSVFGVIALVVIAANLTYSNLRLDPAPTTNSRIVEVVGRAHSNVHRYGGRHGFLVKDGDRFAVAYYDHLTHSSNPAMNWDYKPKFLRLVKLEDGREVIGNLSVEPFN